MDIIARGTTPTIKWNLTSIDPASISRGYLVLMQDAKVIVTKDLSQSVLGDGYLEWTLAQEDTLLFSEASLVSAVCDVVTANGTRVRSPEVKYRVVKAGYEGVI